MYAVIETGGKQYTVKVGETLRVEKLDEEPGASVTLTSIMVVDGDKVLFGKDITQKVTAEVVGTFLGEKLRIFKYKAKKNVRKRQGHRQRYTEIKITSIA